VSTSVFLCLSLLLVFVTLSLLLVPCHFLVFNMRRVQLKVTIKASGHTLCSVPFSMQRGQGQLSVQKCPCCSCHFLPCSVVWVSQGEWVAKALLKPMNAAGVVAALVAMVVSLTSSTRFRRWWYQVQVKY